MSLEVEMPEITTKTDQFGRLRVPAGWEALVPEIDTPKSDTVFRAHVKYRIQDGLSVGEAEADVLDRYQRAFVSWYKNQLGYSIRHSMKKYAQMAPELVAEDGTLIGFDAEQMQATYFPYEQSNRRGKPFADAMLQEMVKEAREKREFRQEEAEEQNDE